MEDKSFSKEEAKNIAEQIIREGKASLPLKLAVAEGKIPLEMRELLGVLYILKDDEAPEVRQTLINTSRNLPEDKLVNYMDSTLVMPEMLDFIARVSLGRNEVLQRIILDESALDTTIEYLATFAHEELLKLIATDKIRIRRHPPIVTAILNNKNASQEVKDTLMKEEEPAEVEKETAQEEDTNLLNRIANLSVGQKVMLGLKGTWQERVILLRDRNKQVATTVLKSPKLKEKEVELISKMRNVPEDVLRGIADNKKWTGKYAIIRNIVENPKAPVGQSLVFVSRLNTMDLRRLKTNRDVSEAVRRLGKQILQKRTAGQSKTQFGRH